MAIMRWLGRRLAWAATCVLLAPVLALVPAGLLDRGPNGTVRLAVFPAGLAASDPFLWDCARNSLVNAGVVAVGSLVLGVFVARLAVRWQFWGRGPLCGACLVAGGVPPLCAALGVRLLLGLGGPWHGAWTEFAAQLGLDPHGWAWIGLAWVGVATGAPLVALTTARALQRVAPVWEDAARLAGAGRWGVWRHVVRPLVRSEVARSSALVFGLTLIEPAGPLLLRLRRTLAFQIIDAAADREPAPRIALLALSAIGYALVVHGVLHWWGGPAPHLSGGAVARRTRAGRLRAAVFSLVLGLSVAIIWLPMLAVVGHTCTPSARDSTAGMRLTLGTFVRLFCDAEVRRLAANSGLLGGAVVAFEGLLARALRSWPKGSFLSRWSQFVPPLALGAGALVLPTALRLAADLAGGVARPSLRAVADAFDPYRTPGLVLFVAVAAALVPRRAQLAHETPAAPRDAALLLGASPGRARRLASDRGWRERLGRPLRTFVLAATNLAPALLLMPTPDSRTLAPGMLLLADQPGDGLHRAAALGACLVALSVAAFVLAELPASRVEAARRDPLY